MTDTSSSATPPQADSASSQRHGTFVPRWRRIVVGALATVGAVALIAVPVGGWWLERTGEKELEASGFAKSPITEFYTPPEDLPAPGTLIRSEPLEYDLPDGRGLRVMYTSQGPDGQSIPVTGLVFTPTGSAPAQGWPVVAYAHGTLGTPAGCAPSLKTTLQQLGDADWLLPVLQQGFAVVATDYVGMGIPAPSTYLLGEQEARDVTTSVQAAQQLAGVDLADQWFVFGTSQGGHSALWTASLAAGIAPELPLQGVVATVPAAELGATLNAQWNTAAAWAIGPELLSSWENAYPERDFRSILTKKALDDMPSLQDRCVVGAALLGALEQGAGNNFFSSNPVDDPDWARTIREQTPLAPPAEMPMLLVQGTGDQVVLAGSNALLQEQWCAAGRNMTALWLGGVSHQDAAAAGGPAVADWLVGRRDGAPAPNSCALGVPVPVKALDNPLPR